MFGVVGEFDEFAVDVAVGVDVFYFDPDEVAVVEGWDVGAVGDFEGESFAAYEEVSSFVGYGHAAEYLLVGVAE